MTQHGLVGVPSTDNPTSKSKALDWKSSFPLSAPASRGLGHLCMRNPCEEGEAVVSSNAGWFSELWKVGFFIFFGKTSDFEREKLILKGFLKSYIEYPNFSGNIFFYF